jgi:hypothetical protein
MLVEIKIIIFAHLETMKKIFIITTGTTTGSALSP